MAEAEASVRNPVDSGDERRLARGVALGLPLVTLAGAAVVGVLMGPATSILVIVAGLLLGVIALLWGSLRVLSGDVPLSPELEALDMVAQGADALATRKKMLLRALKDLENERAIGKIEPEDYEQLSAISRAELKGVLKRIDDALAPHRSRAEEEARAHLAKAGLISDSGEGDLAAPHVTTKVSMRDRRPEPERVSCPQCNASNERDAKFCKECAARLAPAEDTTASQGEDSDEA
jgi:hypothetical protein